jgi:UDP-glucose 4-epimerase
MADRRCGDIATCYAKVDTAAKELGWKARRGLEDMCQTTWNFILKES